MKYRWLTKSLTREDIEAITGKKVLRITSGDLETADPDVTEKGIEIEFEEEVPETKLKSIDNLLPEFKRAIQQIKVGE